ncbi:MAG: hypothetical protein QM606_06685 [Leucobacter sp.]
MRALILAELRAAWSSWLAVLVAFVATSFSLVLALLAYDTLSATIATGKVPRNETIAVLFEPGWNLALALVGTLSVIGAVTGLVVQARRGAVARLSLAGATPGQVSRILLAQLAVVALAGAVIGIALAVVAQPAAVANVLAERGVDPSIAVLRFNPVLMLIGAGGFVLFAMFAGLRQSRVAAAVPPIEALRTVPGAATRRRQIWRWICGSLIALSIPAIAVILVILVPKLGKDGGDTVLEGALICMLLTSIVLSLWAPLTIGLLTRAWTALVPSRSAAWVLARSAVIARGERLSRTVTPIMMAVGLLVGLGALSASVIALLESIHGPALEHTSMLSMLFLIGLILLISMSGGLSVVLMMSRQREAELALAGIVGATVRQQVLVTVFEGIIITVTATILGLVMMGVGMGVFAVGVTAADLGVPTPVIVPWRDLAVIIVICAAVVVAATTLPVLRSLGRPSRQVIAQLAAE